MPNMNITGTTTFTQIQRQFAPGRRGGDEHIRFGDAKGLYTSSKASLTGLKAKLGLTEKMEDRREKRLHGKAQIKQAIDREFNTPGLGDRVLAHLNNTRGMKFSGGITRGDLAAIREGIDEVLPAARRDAALNDPDLGAIEPAASNSTRIIQADVMLRYFGNHFEVLSSPQFWQHSIAKSNSDNFGCALSLCVLDRIAQNGQVTQKDLDDVHRALGPHVGNHPPAPRPSPTLLGGLTDAKLSDLTRLVLNRYIGPASQHPINLGTAQTQEVQNAFGGQLTGAHQLQALHTALDQALTGQYFGPGNLSGPLNGIE
jgi:hypothetical protein